MRLNARRAVRGEIGRFCHGYLITMGLCWPAGDGDQKYARQRDRCRWDRLSELGFRIAHVLLDLAHEENARRLQDRDVREIRSYDKKSHFALKVAEHRVFQSRLQSRREIVAGSWWKAGPRSNNSSRTGVRRSVRTDCATNWRHQHVGTRPVTSRTRCDQTCFCFLPARTRTPFRRDLDHVGAQATLGGG